MLRALLIFFYYITFLDGELSIKTPISSNFLIQQDVRGYLSQYPDECYDMLYDFSQLASNLTFCSILNARPITLCERCVENYVKFRDKYHELQHKPINGTTCMAFFGSHDRLNVIQEYHDNILSMWDKGNCNDIEVLLHRKLLGCFDWIDGKPSLKNETKHFHKIYNETMECILKNMMAEDSDVCNRCMQSYLQLDGFYKTLSADSIGVDSVCMDIVDSMNATRSIWSKTLNCCNLRRTPEIAFLCCAGFISFLPLLYYLSVRFCGPIRDLPNVLKQSRFKQSILRTMDSRSD